MMRALVDEAVAHLARGARRVAVIGQTPDALAVTAALTSLGAEVAHLQPEALLRYAPDVLVVADDAGKESLLRAAASALDGGPLPAVVLHGIAHQEVHPDPRFDDLEAPALVPSYATGHPHTRAHLFDCLRWAAENGRHGAIVELGAFKGGTAVWLARAASELGLRDTPVIAFDSWDGFPPRRSLLDLYEHPRCVFRDLEAVRRYTEPYGIELVPGDIAETAPRRLASEPVLLAFVDTDNYSGARAALEAIVPNLVHGGAIVLDHYTTTADYAYTVGERLAADDALAGAGLLHITGTGVFVRG